MFWKSLFTLRKIGLNFINFHDFFKNLLQNPKTQNFLQGHTKPNREVLSGKPFQLSLSEFENRRFHSVNLRGAAIKWVYAETKGALQRLVGRRPGNLRPAGPGPENPGQAGPSRDSVQNPIGQGLYRQKMPPPPPAGHGLIPEPVSTFLNQAAKITNKPI